MHDKGAWSIGKDSGQLAGSSGQQRYASYAFGVIRSLCFAVICCKR